MPLIRDMGQRSADMVQADNIEYCEHKVSSEPKKPEQKWHQAANAKEVLCDVVDNIIPYEFTAPDSLNQETLWAIFSTPCHPRGPVTGD